MNVTVLIADDNVVMRNLIKFYLKEYGVEINEAKDGIEALSIIKAKEINILFLDINMPNIDGFNVAKYLKEKENPPHIISISSDLSNTNINIFKELGVKYFLNKPLNPKDFKKTMQMLLK